MQKRRDPTGVSRRFFLQLPAPPGVGQPQKNPAAIVTIAAGSVGVEMGPEGLEPPTKRL